MKTKFGRRQFRDRVKMEKKKEMYEKMNKWTKENNLKNGWKWRRARKQTRTKIGIMKRLTGDEE